MAAYPDESVVQSWLDALHGLNVHVKKMFGCYCVYCDDQPIGWLSSHCFSLRETGLNYIPEGAKRPLPSDSIQEIVIPLDEYSAEWIPKAVLDTADILKQKNLKKKKRQRRL